MVAVIEASFRTALMAGFGTLHRAPAGLGPAACRAVGVATVARRTDRKEAVAPAAGLLAKGLVHGVGGPGRPPTGRRNPNRGTTLPTGSVCRRARRSRGSGGPVRTLTFVCGPSVRYPKHRGNTTAGAMDAAAGVDAHDAPTPACKTTRRAVSHKRPQSILFVLIKNPEELRDRTDATIRVQTSSLSRGRRQGCSPSAFAPLTYAVKSSLESLSVRCLWPATARRHAPAPHLVAEPETTGARLWCIATPLRISAGSRTARAEHWA